MTWGEERLALLARDYRRIGRHHLPSHPVLCPRTSCVYNGKDHVDGHATTPGVCRNCGLHGGNGDAECFGWPARKVLPMLDRLPPNARPHGPYEERPAQAVADQDTPATH